MKINEYLLQFLLSSNKEAAIPGLGVFYTDLNNTISFREVAPTDTAFIKYVAEQSGIDELAVRVSVDEWVKSILQDLKTTSRSVIAGIGSFEVGGNKVVFTPEAGDIPAVPVPEPDADDFVPAERPSDVFGMDEDENDPYAPADNDFQDDDNEPSFAARNMWLIITVSVIVIAIIAILLIPQTRKQLSSAIFGDGQEQVQEIVLGGDAADTDEVFDEVPGITPAAPAAPAKPEQVISKVKPSEKQTAPTAAPAKSERTVSKVKPSEKQSAPTAKPAATAAKSVGKYNIIAGTYKVRENADKEVQRFRQMGYNNAKVVVSGGYYYISLKQFLTKDEAIEYKLKLREKKIDGWVKEL
ncbi:MAG: SPOR domain-containing protein [Bacteroidales bacterium]|jgi:nucleoid DNA-binding protein|nr:SPOR domain-containing protein [Bacteroidales bacterium]